MQPAVVKTRETAGTAQPGSERARYPVSLDELQRRWALLRETMASTGIDAIVAQGSNNAMGGGSYARWITGNSAFSAQPQAIIFPQKGLMTSLVHGSLDERAELDGTNPDWPGVGRRLSTPSFPSVDYTGRYDAEILAEELKKRGFKKVGLVGSNSMYYGPISLLKELSAVEFSDWTEMIDRHVAIKSAEEIAFIRQTARVQDEVFEKTRAHIRPGMRDFEVMAYSDYVGQLLGSDTGYYLGCSAPPGTPLGHRTRPQHGRQIREGDVFLWQAETTGPGGYFVHLARILSFGRAPAALADVYAQLIEAQAYTAKLLKPGSASRDIFREYNAYMRSRGLPEEKRLHCHGQGYTSVERPLVRDDESMAIAGHMNIGIHPTFGNEEMFVTLCDNYLVHADGTVEQLHKTPKQIVEL
jgi:Xaa-Pro aminopeptidase